MFLILKKTLKKNFQNISMIVSYYDQISTSDTDASHVEGGHFVFTSIICSFPYQKWHTRNWSHDEAQSSITLTSSTPNQGLPIQC